MNGLNDQELLSDYASHRSEAAFAELVRRHVDLVFSAAVRMVCDTHLAEDVTQGVFVALAQNARSLTDRPVVSGWLHRTAQNLAANVVRADVRRRIREQEAAAMNEFLSTAPDASWEEIAPHLDAALGELNQAEHDAVLLRYFEKKSAREMAQILGISDDAAQKRVSRAVEHIREFFARRGVTVGAGGLIVIISANAVQAAPAALLATISAAALAGTSVTTSTVITATAKTIVMTTLQKTIVTATVAALVGAGVYISKLRDQNKRVQQQVAQLQSDNENFSNRLAAVPPTASNSLPEEQLRELLRLRGEVGTLRQQNVDLKKVQASALELQHPAVSQPKAQQQPSALPDDYPKTPDSATKGIFEAWSRGDWESFIANFGEPGVSRENYDEVFGPYTNLLSGMEVLKIGEPTNSFGPNMWFVPYTVRFSDGHEKSFRLHVAQDAETKRWYFKGGL